MSRDLRYGECLLDGSYKELTESLKNDYLKTITSSYIQNINRVESSLAMPATIAYFMALLKGAEILASLEVTGLPLAVYYDPDPETLQKIKKAAYTHIEAAKQGFSSDPKLASLEFWQSGVEKFNLLLLRTDEYQYLRRGLEASFSGAILGTWTAFETLASDLWEAALNAHPKGLASLMGVANRIKKKVKTRLEKSEQQQGVPQIKEHEGRSIKLRQIETFTRASYNLEKIMGTLLKDQFKFTTLTGIREAYASAFHDHPDSIDEALADQALDALSLARNLIVHRAGVIDAVYREDAATVPIAPQGTEGQLLELDGKSLCDLVNPVLKICGKLAKSVDSYLATR